MYIPWYKPNIYLELRTKFVMWVMKKLKEKNIEYRELVVPFKMEGDNIGNPIPSPLQSKQKFNEK